MGRGKVRGEGDRGREEEERKEEEGKLEEGKEVEEEFIASIHMLLVTGSAIINV